MKINQGDETECQRRQCQRRQWDGQMKGHLSRDPDVGGAGHGSGWTKSRQREQQGQKLQSRNELGMSQELKSGLCGWLWWLCMNGRRDIRQTS